MMQIPTGSDFGKRMSKITATNIGQIPAVSGSSGAIFNQISDFLGEKIEANEKVDAENSLFQHQKKLDDIYNQVKEMSLTGKIKPEQIKELYQQRTDKLTMPRFDNLSLENQKYYKLQGDQLKHNSQQAIISLFNDSLKKK